MSTAEASQVFDQVFENFRKTAEANLQMQQEMFRQWANVWPGAMPQQAWAARAQELQKQWSNTVSDLARRHREVLDRNYQAALDSLEEALRIAEVKDPEEFRQRVGQLCRKTLDCLRDVAQAQMQEFQDAVNKWTELASKAGT